MRIQLTGYLLQGRYAASFRTKCARTHSFENILGTYYRKEMPHKFLDITYLYMEKKKKICNVPQWHYICICIICHCYICICITCHCGTLRLYIWHCGILIMATVVVCLDLFVYLYIYICVYVYIHCMYICIHV